MVPRSYEQREELRGVLNTLLANPAGLHNLINFIQYDLADDVNAFNAAANKAVFATDNMAARLEAARRFGRAEAREELLTELIALTKGGYNGWGK